jgi:hypothetical protein
MGAKGILTLVLPDDQVRTHLEQGNILSFQGLARQWQAVPGLRDLSGRREGSFTARGGPFARFTQPRAWRKHPRHGTNHSRQRSWEPVPRNQSGG